MYRVSHLIRSGSLSLNFRRSSLNYQVLGSSEWFLNLNLYYSTPTKRPFSNVAVQEVELTPDSILQNVFHGNDPNMVCRQCEQTSGGVGCTSIGVCGKTPETSALQDGLMDIVMQVSQLCTILRDVGVEAEDLLDANIWTLRSTFSTLTNVSFSDDITSKAMIEGLFIKNKLECKLREISGGELIMKNHYNYGRVTSESNIDELEQFGREVGLVNRQAEMENVDSFSLNEISLYGLKGVCAYACHAFELGYLDEKICEDIHRVFTKLLSSKPDMYDLFQTSLKVGEINLRVMELLDNAHFHELGQASPTNVRTTAVQGKAILISGHDLRDLKALLQQTEETGINVYTHGEMMPGHAYPELNKYPHLVGNYGTAWQAQKFEFSSFPGPVVITTNCLAPPRRGYKERLYTMNEVQFDGVKHINDRNFLPVIERATEMQGFDRTVEPASYHTVGFNHRSVVPIINTLSDGIKNGSLSRIFLIGGCDGTEWARSYYTDLALSTPKDSIIITLGCAKYRLISQKDLLDEKHASTGLPRVMDLGQCNDAYSAVKIISELSKTLECNPNELPVSLALSHLEQKATAVLLSLLHLNIKNIRLGPRLPAFMSSNILQLLGENYNLMPITMKKPKEDLSAMMMNK